jgi:hypothetical protein
MYGLSLEDPINLAGNAQKMPADPPGRESGLNNDPPAASGLELSGQLAAQSDGGRQPNSEGSTSPDLMASGTAVPEVDRTTSAADSPTLASGVQTLLGDTQNDGRESGLNNDAPAASGLELSGQLAAQSDAGRQPNSEGSTSPDLMASGTAVPEVDRTTSAADLPTLASGVQTLLGDTQNDGREGGGNGNAPTASGLELSGQLAAQSDGGRQPNSDGSTSPDLMASGTAAPEVDQTISAADLPTLASGVQTLLGDTQNDGREGGGNSNAPTASGLELSGQFAVQSDENAPSVGQQNSEGSARGSLLSGTETTQFDRTNSSAGDIPPLGLQDQMNLRLLADVVQTTLGYSQSTFNSDRPPVIGSGMNSANLLLLSSYMASQFAVSSDGLGSAPTAVQRLSPIEQDPLATPQTHS